MALNRLKAGGRGLQPVPEESAANGTTADAHTDAVPVKPAEQCVKSSDGTSTNNGNALTDRRLRRWFSQDATAERHPPDNVSEKEYRIWFPRAEVSDEDPAGRASSDWRTFREYRYTECSRAGRLEKTLSVDEVFNSKDSPQTASVHPPTLAFNCVSCSNSDEDKGGPLDVAGEGRCRMLSSTKSELYREHRSQLLSRLEDDVTSPWEASSLKTDKKPKLSEASDDAGLEKEARTSVCQTSSKKVAFEDDDSKKSSSDIPSSNEEGLAPRSLSGNENGSNSHQAVSAGLQDTSLVSEDDDFDDSKCTYVKVDSVDSEVEDETGVGRETVIGAPSIDDLGYIAEEPEDDVEETTGNLGNENSSATTTHEAAEYERGRMMSSTAHAGQQAPLSSKLGVKEDLSEAGERGNDLQFNESALVTAVHLAADVNTLVGGKSLKCRSDESKSSLLEVQNAKQVSHDHNEQKDAAEAAPRHADLSDTETNESDTKSEESVITVKGEAILLPNTSDQSIDEVLADTVTRSANEKENGLDTCETFITSERDNPELISGKTFNVSDSSDTVNSQEKLGEDNECITLRANVTEDLQKTSKNVSVLVSEYSSNSGASYFGTSIVDNKSGQLTNEAIEFQEAEYSRKDLSESLDRAAHESGQVLSEANAWHREEIEMLLESQELTKNAAAHILDINDHMEKMLDTSSANVTNLLSSKCTFDSEMGANDEVGKRQHAGAIGECGQNDTQESMNEDPKVSPNRVCGLKDVDFLQFLKGGTLTEEVYGLESVTCLSKADDVTENRQESITVVMDDSLLSREFPSDEKSTAAEREGQRENPDTRQGVKNSAENILQIGELLKQDTRQSAEMRFLRNTEALTQNMLMCFTDNEEHTKQTLKTVSSILSDSPRRKNILHDDVARVLGDVKKGDKHLAEGGLKGPREYMREHFDDLALKNGPDFRDEGASHLHPAEIPNENVNKIQDTGVITEKGSMADNKGNIPMILPDEHHLFKQPEISSVEGKEGTGVTRESNDVLEIDHTEQGITQQCLAAHTVPEENSLSSSIKASMLKDVIALNRTDDASSFDDVSLQDDNDQGFESLPCDQTLDPEDLNEEQVKDELDNAEPADDDDSRGADKLTALLDELAEREKATPVSLQYDTGVQTTPTDATDQNNEPHFEHKLESSASNDDSDKEGSAHKFTHGMQSDENVNPAPAMSSDNGEEVVISVPGSISGQSGSAVPDEHEVTEAAGHKIESEDISDAGMEKNTSKISEYYIDLHSVDTSGWHKSLQEKEKEKASEQNETSDKYANEHSVNQATGDDNNIGKENAETSGKESIDIAVATEACVRDETHEEFAMEKTANQSTTEKEITEMKTENLMSEWLETASHKEESAQYETSERFLGNASVKKSTNENEIVKLKLESSETKLRKIAVRDEESMRHEASEEVADGATTHPSSGDIDVTKLKTDGFVDEISELVSTEASVPNETSEETKCQAPISQSTNDDVTVLKAEAPVSEISETALPNVADVQSETLEDFSSEEFVSQATGNTYFSEIREEISTNQLVSTEARAQSKESDEFASERPASHFTDDQHITNEKADAPVSELSKVFDELSAQSKTSDVLASEESLNQSNINTEVTEVKAESSVSDLPKVLMSNETNVHSTSEESASGETACQSTSDGDVTKVKAEISISEVPENSVSTEASEKTETLEESASEASVNESINEKITRVEPNRPVSAFPEIVLSSKLSVERKTPDELTCEESVNLSANNNEVTNVNAEASVSDMPEILVSNEERKHSTSEEFASGETAHPNTSDIEINKVKAETSFGEVPEIVVSDEASVRNEACEESASEALINLSTKEEIKVESGASVGDMPGVAVFNENSEENKSSGQLACDEYGKQNHNDDENTKVEIVTSASELHEIVASNETTDQSKKSDEFTSGEAVRHSTSDVAITEVKEGASTREVAQTTIADEASMQSKTSEKFGNEAPVSETTNENITEATSTELPKIIFSNEVSVRNKPTEGFISEEPVNQGSNNEDIAKADEEEGGSESPKTIVPNEASVHVVSVETEFQSISDYEATKGTAETSTSVVPESIVSGEASLLSETPEKFENEALLNDSPRDNAIPEVKSEASASELPFNEASVQSITSEEFANGENTQETNDAVEIATLKADVSISEVPEMAVSNEVILPNKTYEELKNDAAVNESTNDSKVTEVMAGASVVELPEETVPNEASIGNEISDELASSENVHQSNSGNGNSEVRPETASDLPEIAEPDKANVQISEELAGEESVTRNIDDNDTAEVTPGASVSKSLEFDGTRKHSECENRDEVSSDTSETRLECITKENTTQCIAVDDIAAQGREEAALECTSLTSDVAKRFANADSHDEMTEDNQTASTSAESADGEILGIARSDESIESGSIEEADKVKEDVIGNILKNVAKEYKEINDSHRAGVLDQERHRSQEESVWGSAHDNFGKQKPVYQLADDEKNVSRAIINSEDSALEGVSTEFCEATDDHQTAELGKGSNGDSHILLEDSADATSGASNNERSMHTSEPVENSCEGTDGNNETLAQAADKELGSVTLDSKEHLILTTTGSELEESELLYHEISTSQEVVDAKEPSTAEAYNSNIAGIPLSSYLEQENRDNRSSLLAYAEEIVSTVLTKCVTYLGENDEALRRAELVGRNHCELNADTENAAKEKTISDDYEKELRIPLPQSDSTNRDTPRDAFEPIVSRQSAFEEAISPADHQYPVTSHDANQAAVVLPVAAEKERDSNEKLNYATMSEMDGQSVNMEEIDETKTNSKMAKLATSDEVLENAKVGVPLDSAEDADLLQVTKERRDGDASDSASISEALTEDAASSEAEPHSSVSGAKEIQEVADQTVAQADQPEEKRAEEKSAVARLLDAAGSDPPEGSETRRNFVGSEVRDVDAEPARSVVATGRIVRQESQLNEESSLSDSAACVRTKRFERSASDMEAPAGDDARETEEAENETTTNSFSESSVTTVSMNTEDSAESVSEVSTKASEQASDAVPANEGSEQNSGTSDMGHTDAKNVPNNKFNETYNLDMPDSVADTNDNTTEGREEGTGQHENRASVQGSNWQSGIPHNTEDGNGTGHQGWDMREQAMKTTLPESHDMFSQEVRFEVAVNNGENNKTSEHCTETNFNSSARSNDRDVSKHESSATVDNDMDSLGALSTVYESSLEYVRSYTDEHISASNVTATVSRDYDAVGTTTNSNVFPLKNSSAFGGVFENDEHSDEGKAELNSDESTATAPSCPLQTDRSSVTGNDNIQHVANAASDPEVAPGSVREETAGALGGPVDITGLSAGKMSTNMAENRETNDFQALKDWVTLQGTRETEILVEGDLGDPIQWRKELEENQGGSQMERGGNVTQYSKNTSATGEQRSLTANSRNEGYMKGRDTSSIENDAENVVLPELPETKIEDAHEAHHVVKQALEQDEVATMDFSDEEERSLDDTGAHEHIVFVDVHEIPISQVSGDIGNAEIEQEGAHEEIVSCETSGSAVITTDSNGKRDASSTEETNLAQVDAGVPPQNVEVEAEESSATSTHVHAGSPHVESLSEKLQPTVEALKTAVMVHEETKLEALECSEDLLHSVATEADFYSDIYEQANDGLDADAGIDEDDVEQPTAGLPAESADISSAHGDQQVSTEECSGLDLEGAQIEIKERFEDEGVPQKRSSSDAVEDTIVPEHIQSPSNKSSTESEAGSEKRDVVANGDLKCAVEDFSRLITSDGSDVPATNRKRDEKGRIHDEAVIAKASNENVVPEVTEDEGDKKSQPRQAAGTKEGDKVDDDNQEDILKTDSSESFDLSAAGGENVGESGSRNVKEDTTHKVTEAVEQSERTEGQDGAGSGDRVRSTRIFQRTVKRTESTRTVRRTRSFLPYAKWMRGEAHQRARQEARDEDVTEPAEETLVPQQAFPAMSIPRRGLGPMPDSPDGNVCSVAVQAFPSVVHQGVQVEFDEHDCITRLVELQIAMNEQEEVRRQDMKAACELVEKLEAMQLSESLMRTQLRAMDAERREQSAREARLRDELTAWQETVQQQQLLLQQLKEDLDDTEDTLAAQRQEANRLREQMLVLQESCDSGLLMVDVLGRADKEVQTPDSGQQPLSSSSPYKGIRLESSSPVYLDQLSQHRRLSALVSSQLEATANRIAQLRREAAANRPRGSAIDEYVQDLADKEAIVHQLLLEQQQMDELLSEHDKILAHTRSESLKSKEGHMTPTLQTEEEKLCLVGARCLHENHPEVIARQARLLQRLQVDRIGVFRTPTPLDRSSAGSLPRRAEPTQRPYHALLTQYPVHRYGPRPSVRAAGAPATGASGGSSAGGASDASAGVGSSTDQRRISFSSTSTAVNARSHSVFRVSQQRPQQARQPHTTTTTAPLTAASRGHARQPQSQPGSRQPARKASEAERVNRFVNTSRGGSKR